MVSPSGDATDAFAGLTAVMARLRRECPWDAEQTHRSLVPYLIEEACEVVEAIEDGTDTDLREELGDLLLQVVFHATIATERDAFTLAEVCDGIAEKLVSRHPYVFADGEVPGDLGATWEQRKATEKGRRSALEGIPAQLSSLARASKVITRSTNRGVGPELPTDPITDDELQQQLRTLLGRAHASGLDVDQAARDVARGLEAEVRAAESQPSSPGVSAEHQ